MSRNRGDFVFVGEMAARDEELRQQIQKISQSLGIGTSFPGGPADLSPNGTWPVGGTGGVVAKKHGVANTVSVFIPGMAYTLGFVIEQYTNIGGSISVIKRMHAQLENITDADRTAGSTTGEIGIFEPNSSLGLTRLWVYDANDRLVTGNPDVNTDVPPAASRALGDYLITWNSSGNQAVSSTGPTFEQLITNGKFARQASDASGNTIANNLQMWNRRDATTWATVNNITTTTTDALYWNKSERGVYWINKSDRMTQSLGRNWDKGEYCSFSGFFTCGTTFAPSFTPRLRGNSGTDLTDSAYVQAITLSADTTEHYVAFTLRIDPAATINNKVHLSFETSTTLSATANIRFRKVGGVRGKEAIAWFQESVPVANGDSYYVTVSGTKYPLLGSGDDEINGVSIPTADLGVSPFDPDGTGTRQGFVDYQVR